MLVSLTIHDALSTQETGAIEVSFELETGEHRWCYFMTPTALAACGDFVPGTSVRYHYGSSHMIVVAGELDRALIERVLRGLDGSGDLVRCSRSVDDV